MVSVIPFQYTGTDLFRVQYLAQTCVHLYCVCRAQGTFFSGFRFIYEPHCPRSDHRTCAPSEDSDQIFTGHILYRQWYKVASCGQRWLLRLRGCASWFESSLGACQKVGFMTLRLFSEVAACRIFICTGHPSNRRHVFVYRQSVELIYSSSCSVVLYFVHVWVGIKDI